MNVERIRVACCDASGAVVDLIVVDDFIAWAQGATALIEAKWTGGVYALSARPEEASVGIGHKREAKGTWTAPPTPADSPEVIADRAEQAFIDGLSLATMTAAQQKRALAYALRKLGVTIKP